MRDLDREEAIKVLNEDMEMWARILGKFEKGSYWFQEGLKKIHALRLAIEVLKEKKDGRQEQVKNSEEKN